MKKQLTITISIPAYERGDSLVAALQSIYNQKNFEKVKQVVLMLDAKNIPQNTLKKIKNPKLKVITSEVRGGQSKRLNDIFKYSNSDLLILSNDDVVWGENALTNIIKMYKSSSVDLVAANIKPLKPETVLEKVLRIGNSINRDVHVLWNNSDNYLACNGRLIALSKKLYKQIRIPVKLWNNDAYIFLYTKINKLSFAYSPEAIAYFRAPNSLNEHIKQSSKFRYSYAENSLYFNSNLQNFYNIPRLLLLGVLFKHLIKSPFLTLCYIYISLITKSKKINILTHKKGFWETDKSTKNLRILPDIKRMLLYIPYSIFQ